MALAHLHRIDAGRNMARFYRVDIAPTLFGETCLLKTWGRIGTSGRTVFTTCVTAEEARAAAERLIRVKRRRGYRAPSDGVIAERR